MPAKNRIVIKLYFKPGEFAEVARDAEEAGKRRGGLKLFTVREHGGPGEQRPNTKGIAKFMKLCLEYYRGHRAERTAELARILSERKRLDDAEKKLGFQTP